ncbi:ABC transporter substrate-binding protein, partial [Chloroflexota bacterium]
MFSWKKILGVLLCLVVICSMASLAVSCSDDDEEELSYTITKTATAVDTAGDGIINSAGEIIGYTVEVENTGNTTITGVSVSDSLSINLTRQADDPGNDDTDLDEGETWVYTGSYTVQQSDLDAGSIENTATVSSNELGDKSATKEVTCGETPFADDTVKIGVILPFSGQMALYGEEYKKGIEFVIDQLEAEGALNGAEIQVVWADDQGDPTQSATEMVRLCTTENVCAVLGPFSTANGLAACPLADTYEIPNIGLAVTGDEISDLNLEYWRTIVPEVVPGDYGRGMVDFIKYCIDNFDLPHDR